jgi:hypothetical protein
MWRVERGGAHIGVTGGQKQAKEGGSPSASAASGLGGRQRGHGEAARGAPGDRAGADGVRPHEEEQNSGDVGWPLNLPRLVGLHLFIGLRLLE